MHSRVVSFRRPWPFIAGVFVLWSGPAAAQDTTATLPEIVITATREPTPREHVAARVTVWSGEALRAQGLTTLADALRQAPGLAVVQVGAAGGLTSVFVRGGESDYLQVLVDGVPLNEPGGAYDFANLTLDNVERVELVRGPASVLYGSDAVTGVLQVFTRGGGGAPRGDAGIRAGTNGTLAIEASAQGGDPRIGFAVAGARRRTEGVYPFNNQYRNATASGRLRLAPDARTAVDLTVRVTDTEYHFPTDGAGHPVDGNAFQSGTATALGLDLGRQLRPGWEARLLLTTHLTRDGLDDRPDDAADTVGVFAARGRRNLRRHGAELQVRATVRGVGRVTLGAAIDAKRERSDRIDESSFGTFRSGTDTTVARANRAVYAQLVTTVGRLVVNAGTRLDVNQEFGTFATVRGGAAYRFATGTRAFAAAGTAFKEPTFFENFGGAFVVGNPDLAPERSFSVEGGLEQPLWAGRVTLAATVFRQRFRDLIDFTFAPGTAGDPNYFNLAAASADGLEVELRARPLDRVWLTASYTVLRTAVTDSGFDGGVAAPFGAGQRLLRRPAGTATIEARVRPAPWAAAGVVVHRVASRDDLDFSGFPFDRVTLPGYTLVDLSAELRLLRRPAVTLTGRVANLFNASYQQAFGFRAAGRTVLAGGRVGG